ncbi:pyrethroid hydrolase Ces2e [Musca vetustissima]|uniref:pyrethroid hydrolase Ces2e n=1 Tax=Musca vetustissima TaxID=27455 RepID=UPI002AB77BAA|nr:pyrethroid hydrolase Ces2e [Musca vetustissima]
MNSKIPQKLVNGLFRFYVWLLVIFYTGTVAQQTHIKLKQGTLVGLKVFPDSARSAVYAFLGVPYAQAPIGELRFAPPKPHMGWNRTLQAMSMKPICPQLSNTIYDETSEELIARPAETSEDCLYLNIWVSENGLRYGNLPVLVILTGEDMSYDWPRNRVTGLDIAAEGLVVITIQYRTNIFGWMNAADNSELSGNYGLQDQILALEWIQENVKSLGGNTNQITLLGHGTTGATCAFLHFILGQQSSYSNANPLFNQMLLMSSGNLHKQMASVSSVQDASKALIEKLGCQFEENGRQVVSCLRSKSVSDLLNAFESIYNHGNGTHHLAPSIHFNFEDILTNSSIMKNFPNTIMGITSNEGAFMQDYWLELARESYASLRSYINNTLLQKVLPLYSSTHNQNYEKSIEALNWRYFGNGLDGDRVQLLSSIQKFISEYEFEIPFYHLLNQITNSSISTDLYAYVFDLANSMDMRGKINLFGGASHTSDLPLIFGPSLFQQIARRRFTIDEEKMFRKMRTPIISFIKSGSPNPGRTYDGWLPYTQQNKFIYNLGEMWTSQQDNTLTLDPKNTQQIEQLIDSEKTIVARPRPNRYEFSNSYQIPSDKRSTPNSTMNSHSKRNTEYALHLKRVYGYWQVFLPQLFTTPNGQYTDDIVTQRLLYMEASADAARYKHGFFVMLGLVAVLLNLLGLCIYLLRRDPLDPTPNCDCDL